MPDRSSLPVVAVDVHGPLLDHRTAKWEYFRDVVGKPYCEPKTQELAIIKDLAQQGLSEGEYFACRAAFFDSPHANKREAVPGFVDFQNAAAGRVTMFLITTSRHNNTADSIRASLDRAGIRYDGRIFAVDDELRSRTLAAEGAQIYIYDRPEQLYSVKNRGILTIHLNEPELTTPSVHADFFFNNWNHLISDLDSILARVESP